MVQDVRFSRDVSGDMLLQLQAKLDGGSGATMILLYDGTRPATTETAVTTQTLLAKSPSSSSTTCATETPTGTLTFAAITTVNAEAFSAPTSRTATWGRYVQSDGTTPGTAVMDVDVGLVGSGKFIEMVTTTVVASAPVSYSSGTITFP